MRRTALLVAAVMATAGLAACSRDAGPVRVGPTALVSATFEPAEPVRTVQPEASRNVWAAMHLSTYEKALDACRGPVSIDLGPGRPVLVVEHDYCGGSDWIPQLGIGDVVQLDGVGVRPGLYQVVERKTLTRGDAHVRDLPHGYMVLQTCTSKTEQIEVAVTPVLDAVASSS